MARWLVATLLVLLLLVGAVVIAAVNLESWLGQNKDMIAERGRDALGREIDFDEIGISFTGGLAVRLSGLRIADDPAFSKDDFLRAAALDARVAILPALSGNIEVERFVIREPVIRVIKTGKGLSTDSLGGGGGGATDDAPAGGAAPALLVGLVDITGGVVEYVDQSVSPASTITATALEISAEDVNLEGPIDFEFEARITGDFGGRRLESVPFQGEGTVKQLDPPQVVVAVRSGSVDMAPAGAPAEQIRDLRVNADVSLPAGGTNGSVTVRSPSGRIAGGDYDDLAIDVAMKGTRYDIQKLSLNAFGGTVGATGSYETKDPKRPRFDLKTKMTGVRIERVVATRAPGLASFLTANLDSDLAVQGSGSAWEEMRKVLTGDGRFQLNDAVLHDFNPAGDTIRALVAIPALAGSGLARFAQQNPKVFGVGDTAFDTAHGMLQIRKGWIHVNGLNLATGEYTLTGDGRYGLDGTLDFRTVMALSQALSQQLIDAENRMRYLRGADGRVEVPVAIKGTPPRVAVVPDATRIAQSATREAVTDLLVDAIGGKQRAPDDAGAGTDTGTTQKTPTTAEDLGREALRRGLGGLLGGSDN